MLQHVFERASLSKSLSKIIIATDDERIATEARRFGAPVRMTRPDHISGTDRVAEVAAAEPHDLVVNIQGDEPLIDPNAIDAAALSLIDDANVSMGTLKKRIDRLAEIENPNVVKVVCASDGRAIYFSRSPLPYARNGNPVYFKHIGLYVFRLDFLLGYSKLPVGPLERAESLEQLRALENGYAIRVVETSYESVGVDTPEDLKRVSQLFNTDAPP